MPIIIHSVVYGKASTYFEDHELVLEIYNLLDVMMDIYIYISFHITIIAIFIHIIHMLHIVVVMIMIIIIINIIITIITSLFITIIVGSLFIVI